jgi:hypothetical protein
MFDLTNDAHLNIIVSEIYGTQQNEYRKEIDKQWRILRGDLKHFVECDVQYKHPVTWRSFDLSTLNFARKITEKRAQAYKEKPIRMLGTPEESELYDEKVREAGGKREWKRFDAYYNYFRYSAMWVQFTDGEDEQVASLRALRPDQFSRVVDDFGNTKLFAAHLGSGGLSSKNLLRGNGVETNIQDEPEDNNVKSLALWTDTQHVLLEVSGDEGEMIIHRVPIEGNEDNVNELGMIPATFQQETDSRDRPAFNTLADQTIDLNYIMSVINTGTALQTFGNLVVKRPQGQALPDDFMYSLHSYIDVPVPMDSDNVTDVDYITPGNNVSSALEVFNTNLMQVLDENNVKGGESVTGNDKFTSGFDRLLSRMDTTEVIESNQDLYVENENDIYHICKAFYEETGRSEFKTDDLVTIFKKPRPMMSDSEVMDLIERKLELGLIEEHEKFIIMNPNISEDEAKEKLKLIEDAKPKMVMPMIPPMEGDNDADNEEV